ncbi:uncharacterized protein L201_004448 [Kwoniella dendrophila CBS 6074]|uniref:DUF974-domain-containing protein n=1 Tax=Kwoniella dendrophila CBS 6074 TaxID=1295534 RepID=A0AAX4JXA9_9TREE
MEPPLTLIINQISPPSLIPSYIPSTSPHEGISLNDEAIELPKPPKEFNFSPTPNYPSTHLGLVYLGSILSLDLSLENTNQSKNDILGVKMMIETQGPGGRFRLGEVVHQNNKPENNNIDDDDTKIQKQSEVDDDNDIENEQNENKLPILKYGEKVDIKLENEIKDLGLNVLIVSIAWETLEGRKTFQRFLKFHVNPPLSIKTRIQTPMNPNTLLSITKREKIYLEILMQNVSNESMILSKVYLEPVKGLLCNSLTNNNDDKDEDEDKIILLPEDIRQFLFILSPEPDTISTEEEDYYKKSIFPPIYPGGTILPLGRLDVTWLLSKYHLPGRLQTSTLNRRVPVAIQPPVLPPKGGIIPTRTLSNQSNISTSSPLATPNPRDRLSNQNNNNNLLAPSPMKGTLNPNPNTNINKPDEENQEEEWEFDLTLIENENNNDNDLREFEIDKQFSMDFKLGIRSIQSIPEFNSNPANSQQHKSSTSINNDNLNDSSSNDKKEDDDDTPLSRISSRVSNKSHDIQTPKSNNTYQKPKSPRIAIQYLTPLPQQPQTGPKLSILSPTSRTNTPLSPPPSVSSNRPFSPLTSTSTSSRPLTPSSVANQLRQAQQQGLNSSASSFVTGGVQSSPRYRSIPLNFGSQNEIILDDGGHGHEDEENEESFPPQPHIFSDQSISYPYPSNISDQAQNGILYIGNSLIILPKKSLYKTIENLGPSSYNNSNPNEEQKEIRSNRRWETEYKFKLKFISFNQGLMNLGGLRILHLYDGDNNNDDSFDVEEQNISVDIDNLIDKGKPIQGKTLKEYNSLGDLSIVG